MIGRNRLVSSVALAALFAFTGLGHAQTRERLPPSQSADRGRPALGARDIARQAELEAGTHPRKASPKVQAAKAYEATGDVNASRDAAAEALRREPNNVDAMQVLARLAAREENWSEAVALLRRAAMIDPNNASTQLALGQALERTGDRAGSDAAYAVFKSLRERPSANGLPAKR